MPSRRTYLAGVSAALAGVAGCVDGAGPGGSPSGTRTGTPSTNGTDPLRLDWNERAELSGAKVTPRIAAVRDSVVRPVSADTWGVVAFDAERMCFALVAAVGDVPAASAYRLDVPDGGEGWTDPPSGQRIRPAFESAGTTLDASDAVGFTVPAPAESADARLVLRTEERTVSWALPEDARTALGRPTATFTVESVSAPASVAAGESFEVSGTATNEADVPGTFRAVLNETGPTYRPHRVTMDLAAGKTGTWSMSFVAGDSGTTHRYGFRAPDTSESLEVTVR